MRQLLVNDDVAEWGRKHVNRAAFKKMKDLVASNSMWKHLRLFCKIMKPIVKLVKLVDSDMPSMGKVR